MINKNSNSNLNLSDDKILKVIHKAVLNYNLHSYTHHYDCEVEKCHNCGENVVTFIEHDVFDYIAMELRSLYEKKCTNKI